MEGIHYKGKRKTLIQPRESHPQKETHVTTNEEYIY